MDLEELRPNLPVGEIPRLLALILEYQNRNGDDTICRADFQVFPLGRESLHHWCHGHSLEESQFAVFGTTAEGSLYAWWLYPGRTLGDAPIVLLDCDVDDSRVIAGSLADFAGLLAAGWDTLDFGDEAERASDIARFRAWVEALGIAIPADRRAAQEAARRAHPDLKAWLDENHRNDWLEGEEPL